MKKFLLLLIVIASLAMQSLAQNQHHVDSLENELKKFEATKLASGRNSSKMNDTLKVTILTRLSEAYWGNNPDKAMDYARQMLALSEQIDFGKGIGNAYNTMAQIHEDKGNYSEAMEFNKKALKIRARIGDKRGVAGSYINMGSIYKNQGNYEAALKNYLTALKINEEIGNKKGIASSYNNIGIIYEIQGHYERALEYYLNSLKIKKEFGTKRDILSAYGNIGNVYYHQADSANKAGDSVVFSFKLKQALENYLTTLDISKEIGNKQYIATCYTSIGLIYQRQGNDKLALENYLASLKIAEEIGDKRGISSSSIGIGTIYRDNKDYSNALSYIQKGLQLAKDIDERDLMRQAYQELSETFGKMGNYKNAYEYYQLNAQLKDSLLNVESSKQLHDMSAKYESEKKEHQITLLNKDKEIQSAQIKRQALIKNAILAGAGIVGIFSFFLIRSFNRKRKTVFEKQVSEVEMKALRSQMNPHFIFNSLQSIKKYILENERNVAAEYLSKFSSLMRLILENSRKHEVPLEKDLSALDLYMELESLRFQNRFQYKIEVDPQIDREDTLIPPLLLQPFVENSIIHGVSSKENGMIIIKVTKEDNMIRCTVEDNGIGRGQSVQVETGEKKKRESLGMKITEERLSIINQLKKVKTAVNIFDLKDDTNNPGGLRVELLLPFETAF